MPDETTCSIVFFSVSLRLNLSLFFHMRFEAWDRSGAANSDLGRSQKSLGIAGINCLLRIDLISNENLEMMVRLYLCICKPCTSLKFTISVLRSKRPSGMRAKRRTVAASNNGIIQRDHSIIVHIGMVAILL